MPFILAYSLKKVFYRMKKYDKMRHCTLQVQFMREKENKNRLEIIMKKKLALLIAGVMMLSVLGGCGKEGQDNTGATGTETQQSQEVEKEKVPPVKLSDVSVQDYVTMGDYKNLEFSYDEKMTFTEDYIEMVAVSVYSNYVTKENGGITDRAAQNGDIVNIDYSGIMVGETEPFAGGTAAGATLELGSGTFIPGFEEGLVGVKPGETVDVEMAFPDPYYNDETKSGKPVVFTVTVNFIYPKTVSEMTDAGVAGMSKFTTVQELVDYCRTYMELGAEETYNAGKQNAAFEELMKVAVINDVPEGLVQYYYDELYKNLEITAGNAGMNIDMYCKYMAGTDAETYVKSEAEETAKMGLAVQYVANAENLNVSDEELEDYIKELAEKNGVTEDDVKAFYETEALRESYMMSKVADFLAENGNVTENPVQ